MMKCNLDSRKKIDDMIREAAREPRPITVQALAELRQCSTVGELHKLAKGGDQ